MSQKSILLGRYANRAFLNKVCLFFDVIFFFRFVAAIRHLRLTLDLDRQSRNGQCRSIYQVFTTT